MARLPNVYIGLLDPGVPGGVGGGGDDHVCVTLQSLTVSPSSVLMAPAETQQMTAIGTYSDNSTLNLTSAADWSSDDESTATVTSGTAGGVVSGVDDGTASITASVLGITGSASVLVETPLQADFRSTAAQGYTDGGNTPLRVTTVPIPVPSDIAGSAVYLTFSNQSAALPNTANGAAVSGMNFALYDAIAGANGPAATGSDLLGGIGIGVNVSGSGGIVSIGPVSISGVGANGYLVAVMGNPANTHFNIAPGITTGEYVDGTNTVDPVPGGLSGLNNATGTCRLIGWQTARPRIVVAGDSLANAYSLGYTVRREDSAFVKIGPDNDWAVDTLGIAGMRLDQATSLPNFFDGLVADTDTLLLSNLSINSLPHWANLAAAQAEYASFISYAQGAGFGKVVLCTLPASAAYVTYETLRQQVNTWLRTTAPAIVDGIVDVSAVVDDPGTPTQLLPAYALADGTHWTAAGHAAVAAEITSTVGPLV